MAAANKTPDFTLRVGAGVQLVAEERLYAKFSGYGLSLEGFRKWLDLLEVPVLVMPDGSRLINRFTFAVAITRITRIGSTLTHTLPEHPDHDPKQEIGGSGFTQAAARELVQYTLSQMKFNFDRVDKDAKQRVEKAVQSLTSTLARAAETANRRNTP